MNAARTTGLGLALLGVGGLAAALAATLRRHEHTKLATDSPRRLEAPGQYAIATALSAPYADPMTEHDDPTEKTLTATPGAPAAPQRQTPSSAAPATPVSPAEVPAEAVASLIATGDPHLDRPGIRGNIAHAMIAAFGLPALLADPRLARAMIAIVWKESQGLPRWYLGDTKAAHGPSIGPGQVYRSTAEAMGLWHPPPGANEDQAKRAYAALAHNEALTIGWAARVFAQKYAAAHGSVAEAIRRYNGSGPHADAYRNKVLAWAAEAPRGWDLIHPWTPPTTGGVA